MMYKLGEFDLHSTESERGGLSLTDVDNDETKRQQHDGESERRIRNEKGRQVKLNAKNKKRKQQVADTSKDLKRSKALVSQLQEAIETERIEHMKTLEQVTTNIRCLLEQRGEEQAENEDLKIELSAVAKQKIDLADELKRGKEDWDRREGVLSTQIESLERKNRRDKEVVNSCVGSNIAENVKDFWTKR